MRQLRAIVGLAFPLLATSVYASFDGTVTMTAGTYEYGNGGEFTAATTGLGTFTTFCLEYNEEFELGGTYAYNMNSGAVAGDSGAHATDPHTGLPMDNISMGTAWLYSQFRNGAITINSTQAAGNFQDAIWYLENETTSLSFNGADGTAFFNAALAGTGLNGTSIFGDSNGKYGVIAMNLFDGPASQDVTAPNGTIYQLNQDQLAIVPEPETILAGALLLLPLGTSAFRIIRNRRATAVC